MRISPVTNYYTMPRQNTTVCQPSFRAIKSLGSKSEDFNLRTPEGLPVLKAFAENKDIKKFCSKNDVDVTFDYYYSYSGHYYTSMDIKCLNGEKRDVIRYEIDTGKSYQDKQRYAKTAEVIKSITYDELEEKSFATKRREKAEKKALEDAIRAAKEYDEIMEELFKL